MQSSDNWTPSLNQETNLSKESTCSCQWPHPLSAVY